MLKQLLSVRWILTSLLVLAALGVLVRLGIWQLERLEQRRAMNARVSAQISREELDLNRYATDPNLTEMEYRDVVVRGVFLPEQQIVLRNEVFNQEPGFHLVTPLLIDGSQSVVLVDRGWIPLSDASPDSWTRYNQPGQVSVQGVLRRSEAQARFGQKDGTRAGEDRQVAWNRITLELIQPQITYPLLPVFIQQTPISGQAEGLPAPVELSLDLSEGSHFGYALQWFAFAAILATGYPFYVRKTLRPSKSNQNLQAGEPSTQTFEVPNDRHPFRQP